jgi:hypothetical protein
MFFLNCSSIIIFAATKVMFMQLFKVLFITIFTLLLSCKDLTNTTKATPDKEEDGVFVSLGKQDTAKVAPTSLATLQDLQIQSQNLLKYRLEKFPNKYAIIDVGAWEIEGVYQDGTFYNSGEYAGHWIDFDEHNNFEYGHLNEVRGKGKYHFETESQKLLLSYDKSNVKPAEYEAKIVNTAMILMGTETFQDNDFQCKLVKIAARPVVSNK